MVTIDEMTKPIEIRADAIDMGLIHLLETRYLVIVGKRDNEIVIELYNK